MKTKRYLWVIAVVGAAGLAILAGCRKSESPPAEHRHAAPAGETAPKKNGERKVDYWTCSMHPQIHADKPGNCPICGMTLVPVYAAGPSSQGQPLAAGQGSIALTEEGIRQAGVAVEKAGKRKLVKEL